MVQRHTLQTPSTAITRIYTTPQQKMEERIETISNIETEVRNNLWKRLSKNVSRSKIGAFARAISKAFGRLVDCRGGKKARKNADDIWEGLSSAPTQFVYPDDRYITNSETLTQLQVLEERMRKQTMYFNNFKEKLSKKTSEKDVNAILKNGTNVTYIATNTGDLLSLLVLLNNLEGDNSRVRNENFDDSHLSFVDP